MHLKAPCRWISLLNLNHLQKELEARGGSKRNVRQILISFLLFSFLQKAEMTQQSLGEWSNLLNTASVSKANSNPRP